MKVSPLKLKASLKACIKEGVVAQIMIGIFDYYLIPLAIFLHATTVQIGLLVSLPSLLSSLSQILAVKSVDFVGSRKRLLTWGTLIQAFLLLPIPFFVLPAIPYRIELLLLFVIVFRVLGSVMGPAWGSIVSDYLPEDLRGKYFGKRAQIVSFVGVAAMAFWGIFLSYMDKVSSALGLFIVFLSAAVCRFMSSYYMHQFVELPHPTSKADKFTFWMFIRRFQISNFVKFVLFIACVTFATQLSAAYTNVYMLKTLHYDYTSYMAVNLASVLTSLVSFPIWGKHADLIGNAKILKLTSLLIPLSPLLWMFNRHPWELVIIEAASGFIWGGFNLCATNFIYDAVSAPKRVQCLCYFNLINGAATFAGASLGGFLATRLPSINGSPIVALFGISVICRLLAHFILSPSFQEVRVSYQKVNSVQLFFSVLGVHSLTGANAEWQLFPVLKRFIFKRA